MDTTLGSDWNPNQPKLCRNRNPKLTQNQLGDLLCMDATLTKICCTRQHTSTDNRLVGYFEMVSLILCLGVIIGYSRNTINV